MKKLLLFVIIAFAAQACFAGLSGDAITALNFSRRKPAFFGGVFVQCHRQLPVSIEASVLVTTSSAAIPMLMRYPTAGGFYAEVSPQISFLFASKKTFGGAADNIIQAPHAGWCFGAGYEPHPARGAGLGINMRYSVGLTTINRVADKAGRLRNRMTAISLTYRLGVRR